MIHQLPGLLLFCSLILGFFAFVFQSWVLLTIAAVLFGLVYLAILASGWASISEIINIIAGRPGKDD